jgi:predicted nucleotidyltransferase
MKHLIESPLNEDDRRAVEAAAEILRQDWPVERIVLFGSKARGEDGAESDIDLLVLTRRRLTWEERGRAVDSLFDLQLERRVVISLLMTSAEEWEQGAYRVMPIRGEIERDGIPA